MFWTARTVYLISPRALAHQMFCANTVERLSKRVRQRHSGALFGLLISLEMCLFKLTDNYCEISGNSNCDWCYQPINCCWLRAGVNLVERKSYCNGYWKSCVWSSCRATNSFKVIDAKTECVLMYCKIHVIILSNLHI